MALPAYACSNFSLGARFLTVVALLHSCAKIFTFTRFLSGAAKIYLRAIYFVLPSIFLALLQIKINGKFAPLLQT